MTTQKNTPFRLSRPICDFSGKGHESDLWRLRDAFEHLAILGSTGTGKTSGPGAAIANALINPHGLHEGESVGMVVPLYKDDGEDWAKWAWQQGREKDLVRIGAEHAHVFNILQAYAEDEPLNAVNALMNISELSATGRGRNSEPFWEVMQRKYLDRLIRLNQLCGEPLNIATLNRLHDSAPQNRDQLYSEEFEQRSFFMQSMNQAAEKAGEQHPDFQLVADFVHEMVFMADETASSIRAMASSVLEPFVASRMLNNLFCGRSDLQLEDLFTGKILLLDIPVQQHEFAGRIAQVMLMYAIMKEVEKRDLQTHGNPLIFWIDECQNFLTKYTQMFMSVSRSSRCGMVLMTQNISNMIAAMGSGMEGRARVDSLLGLCNTKIFGANNDPVTNEFAANSIGKAFRDVSSINLGFEGNGSSGVSQQLHQLVEPREFTMLRKGGDTHDYLVDTILVGTGRVFSNGLNYLPVTFRQHFAR